MQSVLTINDKLVLASDRPLQADVLQAMVDAVVAMIFKPDLEA